MYTSVNKIDISEAILAFSPGFPGSGGVRGAIGPFV